MTPIACLNFSIAHCRPPVVIRIRQLRNSPQFVDASAEYDKSTLAHSYIKCKFTRILNVDVFFVLKQKTKWRNIWSNHLLFVRKFVISLIRRDCKLATAVVVWKLIVTGTKRKMIKVYILESSPVGSSSFMTVETWTGTATCKCIYIIFILCGSVISTRTMRFLFYSFSKLLFFSEFRVEEHCR